MEPPPTPAPAPRAAQVAAAIALGGALGALLRAGQAELLPARGPGDLPGAVLVVNVAGSLSLGALLGLIGEGRPLARAFVGVGVYGAYTTFAGFALVALGAGGVLEGLAYVLASVAVGLLAAWVGLRLGRRGPRPLALLVTLAPPATLAGTLLAARLPAAPPATTIAAVALGGGLGALTRAGLAVAGLRVTRAFPWGTLAANVLGCLLAGALAPPGPWRALVVTGWLGGLTTFSTFSVEALRLRDAGRASFATLYVLGNVALGCGAAALGQALR